MITGRGKPKIRPPRRGVVGGGDGDFEMLWDTLSTALREIHCKNASKLSFEQLYRASYKIVLKKQGEMLYDRVKAYEEQWFGTEVMPPIRSLITNNLVNVTMGGVVSTTPNERRITGERFLTGLKDSWQDHKTVMNMTTDVLMYMDRVYCGDNRKASIFTTAMGLFRDNILRERFNADLITFDILNSVILDQINMERQGDVINKLLIRSCVNMLEALYENNEEEEGGKLYMKVFQPAFIEASTKFYEKECADLLREGDASAWLKQTTKRFDEEEDRCQTTISTLSTKAIAAVVEQKLLRDHVSEFLALEGSGLVAMIENDRHEDLKLAFKHISRIDPMKEPLKVALTARVTQLGSEINQTILNTDFGAADQPEEGEPVAEGSEKPKSTPPKTNMQKQTAAAIKWVDLVLQLKDKFDTLWDICFDKDLILQTALTKSYGDFINEFARSSEYLSLFIDDHLKRGIKGKTEAEIDVVLDKATTLIRYIRDKDMFERYYNKHLARRLLHGKSESADVEKQMISRMKQELGSAFTSKLEVMFKDMNMSEELTAGYRAHISDMGDVGRKSIDLSVNVLTTNNWPMEAMGGRDSMNGDGTRQICQWPLEIQKLQESFKLFYLKSRNGRTLTWLDYLGSADMRCRFPKIPGKEGTPLGKDRTHEINVPTYGMVVLLLFNDLAEGEYLSFDEIQQRTNIPSTDLARLLHTLAVLPKARVLTKSPQNKELPKAGDQFCFNASFFSKSVKIKAPVIAGVNKVEAEDERKDTEEKMYLHRGSVVDTAVVRIMKARKEFTHTNLLAEIISQLSQRFRPDVTMVKKQIESLIERDYLERVEGASVPTYRYLA